MGETRGAAAAAGAPDAPAPDPADGTADRAQEAARTDGADGTAADAPAPGAADRRETDGTAPDAADAGAHAAPDPGADGGPDGDEESGRPHSRRPPAVTLDTARPEGGGRAAPGDAPAPARQWPLLTVIGMAAAGLLIVGTDGFRDAFRIGTMLIGAALLTGAVLRRVMPSVGMLAVRSRFTDMLTYGVLGTAIVLLALVAQPKPWLDIPILEEAVHFTVR
ncbi:DUF3017 domain-containing protein [Streptomyces genisteinicus]|uniref:DUF3017 domain-containing protein n=1 Tax=Streptomyces genisteinicus TaxID=2768068 RepID=A0A7H0HWD0_9ACTN|nr:DUF3017 domain-containing protein [Streptomyces genisteinicus]QNP64846.1 DUF3017 domain-containing protein [Streptomyces genisteinicus]